MATDTASRIGRNDLCPCGSGKKYKRCCGAIDTAGEDPASRFFGVAAAAAALMLVGGVLVWTKALVFDEPSVTQVWSPEHGHYHDVGGGEPRQAAAAAGRVWSEEHGHWHAADGGELPAGGGDGAGRVWSEEHGHWHAADGGELPAGGGGGAGRVWSEEHGHWHDAPTAAPPVAAETPVPGALDALRAAQRREAGQQAASPPGEAASPPGQAN